MPLEPSTAAPHGPELSLPPTRGRRSRPRHSVVLAVLCLSLALGPGPLRAQTAAPTKEDLAEAKLHFQAGVKAFESGVYPTAAAEFQAAYRLSKRPDLLYNLARVAETMGQPSQAIDYLEGYLRDRPDAKDRAQVRKDMERLRRLMQAEREVQAAPVPEQPLTPQPVTPKPPQPVAPPVAPQPTAPAAPTLWQKLPPWPALTLMGGGTLLLITGFGLGGAALSTADQVQTGMTYNRDLDSRGRSLNAAAISLDVLGGLALAAGVGWTVWWALHRKPATPAKSALLLLPTVDAAPGAAVLGIGGRF